MVSDRRIAERSSSKDGELNIITIWGYRRYIWVYLVNVLNIKRRNDKSRRSYVNFGDVYSKIEFTEACSGKLVISLSRIVIMKIEVEDVKKKCLWWCG